MRSVTPRRPRRRLTPRLRRLAIWGGAPLLVIICVAMVALAARSSYGGWALTQVENELIAGTGALGFVVSEIRIEGNQTTSRATVLAALSAVPGTPILAVHPSVAKERLESLPWVRSAVIERRLPDLLSIHLVERKPLAVWQHDGGKQELIDNLGTVIPVRDLGPFARLPTVVGEDAASRAATILDVLATQPDLYPHVTDVIWVGGRRWDIRLDHTIDVMLPENDPAAAWDKLADLDQKSSLLKREVQAVDLRLSDRVIVRVVPDAAKPVSTARKGRPGAKST